MTKIRKLTIIKEKGNSSIIDTLVARFNDLTKREEISIYVEVVTFGEEATKNLSGDILLLSLPLMKELPSLNELKTKFYFVCFIDPYAYAQLDGKRLLKQLQLIEQMEAEKIEKFHPKKNWTYTDYFLATTQMKKELAVS